MNLNTQKAIGITLKKLRLSHQISQEYVSQQLGISRSLYAQYELGNRTPDAEFIFLASKFFHVDMERFFSLPEQNIGECSESTHSNSTVECILVSNYECLTSFSQGRLLEYSQKLREWDTLNRRNSNNQLHNQNPTPK